MPTAITDGITTRYEVVGSGPPVLMFAPGGFDASLEKWTTFGVYARIKLLDRWPVGGAKYRIDGQQRFAEHLTYVQQHGQTEESAPSRLLQFLDAAVAP